jgi:hypothetical protein
MDQHEEKLFQAFVVSTKQRRYVELLTTKRGRDKIRFTLDHFDDLDPRYRKDIPTSEQTPSGILKILKSLGAPSLCHIISSGSELDGREMDLSEALPQVIGRGMGTFVSCVPGKLAYFEGEEPKRRFICHRSL